MSKKKMRTLIALLFDEIYSKKAVPLKTYFNTRTRQFTVEWIDGDITEVYVHPDDEVNFNIGFALCYIKKTEGKNWRKYARRSYKPITIKGESK